MLVSAERRDPNFEIEHLERKFLFNTHTGKLTQYKLPYAREYCFVLSEMKFGSTGSTSPNGGEVSRVHFPSRL